MTDRLAIFIDGENVSSAYGPAILRAARVLGDPIIRRIHGNVARIPGWAAHPDFRTIHAGGGKNAADMALAIDAIDLWRSAAFDTALLVTSDSDFAHLANWLRERGARVMGLGEAKAPENFRAACSRFVQLPPPRRTRVQTRASNTAEPMKSDDPGIKPKATRPDSSPSANPQTMRPSEIDIQIRAAIAAGSTGHAGIKITALNTYMQTKHNFRISLRTGTKWHSYLQARPTLFAVDPKGKDAMVRFLPAGFRPAKEPCAINAKRPPDPPGGRPCAI